MLIIKFVLFKQEVTNVYDKDGYGKLKKFYDFQ